MGHDAVTGWYHRHDPSASHGEYIEHQTHVLAWKWADDEVERAEIFAIENDPWPKPEDDWAGQSEAIIEQQCRIGSLDPAEWGYGSEGDK
jgi:hypothetical protein